MWLVSVVIRRYIDILIIIINFPYSTCIRSFLAEASLLLCSFLNVFSVFIIILIESVVNRVAKCELGEKMIVCGRAARWWDEQTKDKINARHQVYKKVVNGREDL